MYVLAIASAPHYWLHRINYVYSSSFAVVVIIFTIIIGSTCRGWWGSTSISLIGICHHRCPISMPVDVLFPNAADDGSLPVFYAGRCLVS